MLWLQKFLHPTVISVHEGRCQIAKGQVSTCALQDIESVLSEFHVAKGTITLDTARCARFSGSIPSACHQRLRNILASF